MITKHISTNINHKMYKQTKKKNNSQFRFYFIIELSSMKSANKDEGYFNTTDSTSNCCLWMN